MGGVGGVGVGGVGVGGAGVGGVGVGGVGVAGGGEAGGGVAGGGVAVGVGNVGSCCSVGAPGNRFATFVKRLEETGATVYTGVNDDPHVTLVLASVAVAVTGTDTPGVA